MRPGRRVDKKVPFEPEGWWNPPKLSTGARCWRLDLSERNQGSSSPSPRPPPGLSTGRPRVGGGFGGRPLGGRLRSSDCRASRREPVLVVGLAMRFVRCVREGGAREGVGQREEGASTCQSAASIPRQAACVRARIFREIFCSRRLRDIRVAGSRPASGNGPVRREGTRAKSRRVRDRKEKERPFPSFGRGQSDWPQKGRPHRRRPVAVKRNGGSGVSGIRRRGTGHRGRP